MAILKLWKQCLPDIAAERVQEMICLGDIVGYGPNPAECIEMIRCLSCAVVMGNHDEACVEPEKRIQTSMNMREPESHLRGEQLSDAQKTWLRNRPIAVGFRGLYRCPRVSR